MGIMIKLAICDDHEMVREALTAVLESFDGISVVGAGDSLSSLVEVMSCADPDVVLVDVRLGEESGLDVARFIQDTHPMMKIIMLTSFASDEVLVDAFDLGASAFILKSGRPQELVETIRSVAAGAELIDPDAVETARQRLLSARDSG
jgi:DNA-binding NarL/FixJ family response regulator